MVRTHVALVRSRIPIQTPAPFQPQVELGELLPHPVGLEAGEDGFSNRVGIPLGPAGAHRVDSAAQDLGSDLPRRRGDLPLIDPAEPVFLEDFLERGFELVAVQAGKRRDGLTGLGGLDAAHAHHCLATELVAVVAVHLHQARLERAERDRADRGADEQGDEVALHERDAGFEPLQELGRRTTRAVGSSVTASGLCVLVLLGHTLDGRVREEVGGGRGDALTPLGVTLLVRGDVGVELDTTSREQGAVDVFGTRSRSEVRQATERRDVDVEAAADDRRERGRTRGPLHHVPRLGERPAPAPLQRREEDRGRQRRHYVRHDLARIPARQHRIVGIQGRIELVCGHRIPTLHWV